MDEKSIALGERLRANWQECEALAGMLQKLDDAAQLTNARLVMLVGRDCPLVARMEDCGEEGDSLVIEGVVDGRKSRFQIEDEDAINGFARGLISPELIHVARVVDWLKDAAGVDWEIDPPFEADGI